MYLFIASKPIQLCVKKVALVILQLVYLCLNYRKEGLHGMARWEIANSHYVVCVGQGEVKSLSMY